MRRSAATVMAGALTVLVYIGIAWLARGVDVPPDVPTARMAWTNPFRVVASLGFALAQLLGTPHLAGNLVVAVALGGVLGATFSLTRRIIRLRGESGP